MYSVKLITDIIEKIAPKKLAFNWDNVGLQIGDLDSEVNKVLLCLDVNSRVITEAIENKVQLIITHHPLIFSPLKNITNESYKGKLILNAIKNNINIYSVHTNIDGSEHGLNTYIANLFNLKDIEILDPIGEIEELYKITVFVPEGYEEVVSDALSSAGAGHVGNYSHCTFRTLGVGTFMALEGTKPFVGKQYEVEKVKEVKIESIIPKRHLYTAIDEMIKAHPYEEVAYDIFRLENLHKPINGIGRVGNLENPTTFKELVGNVKKMFNISYLKTTGMLDRKIEKIAIVNGSGAEYISKAAKLRCDVLITGDVKYHDAQKAEELNLNLIDLGHYESELFFINLLNEYLSLQFNKENIKVELINSKVDSNPFTTI